MIHSTAIVDPKARVADDVEVGPYSIIGAEVQIGAGTVIGPHVVLRGPTEIGTGNQIFQFSSIGDIPQDKKFHGESSRLVIGDNNTIRECVTINRGTEGGGGETRIGDDNWIMAYVHVAHDCRVGDHTVLANNVALAGHVSIGDYAILGGFSLIHQFCRIGAYAFTAMGSAVSRDVPPFVTVAGKMSEPRGLNSEGLKRHGYSTQRIQLIKKAYKLLYKSGLGRGDALEAIQAIPESSTDLDEFVAFVRGSERSILR